MDRLGRIAGAGFSSGLFPDQKLQTAPLWAEGSNVLFSNEKIEVFPGASVLFTRPVSEAVTGLLELSPIVTGNPGVLVGHLDRLYCWDSVAGIQALGSGYTGSVNATASMPATRWSMAQYNEYMFATNGVDPLQLCKVLGTGFVAQTANTSTQFKQAEIIRKHKQFVLAFNLTLSTGVRQPNAFAWCDVNLPEVWVPAATNSARKLYIPHLKSDINCVEGFGESLFAYTLDGVYNVSYVGYPDVYSAVPLLSGIGTYGKFCVTEARGKHVGFGPRGLWSFDGQSYDYIDNPPVRKFLRDNLNREQASKCVVYNDRTIQHVLIFFPGVNATENSMGIAWNYIDNNFTEVVFARSAASDTGQLEKAVTGDSTGNVYSQSEDVPAQTDADHSIPITSSFSLNTGYGDGGYGDRGYGGIGG
jgi:hypothetical protein